VLRPLKHKDYFLSILSAALLILSFPNSASGGNLWICAWFAFVPLLFALKGKSTFRSFLLSYLTGIIFWLGTIYWLAHVTSPGMLILVLYLALYFGFFGLIISLTAWHPPLTNCLFIPSAWVILEYLRSHLLTGFPWALLGYSQYKNLPIIQFSDITGAWGVSFLVMLVNVSIANKIKRPLGVLLCILVTLAYGYHKIYRQQAAGSRQQIKVSVIQGNIPQELKWDTGAQRFIVNKYSILTAESLKDKSDLVIWPEASYPLVLSGPLYYDSLADSIKEISAPLLFGGVTVKDNLYYNSALLVSGGAGLLDKYDKIHLVPFGEYIPLKNIFPFLETIVPIGDITAGRDYTVFEIPNPKSQIPNKFSVLICFEDLFPELSREFVRRGAGFLVNITNDAWYKETSAPYQHLQASVFRAIENRVFLVRAANTGISGFINPSGRVVSLAQDKSGRDIFIDGYDTEEITLTANKEKSFYTRYGDVFILFCLIFIFYSIISTSYFYIAKSCRAEAR
jgi:apolipoprotein N-acyltransferase